MLVKSVEEIGEVRKADEEGVGGACEGLGTVRG